MECVSYIRVSTQRQGSSGLGLSAQRSAVQQFCKQHGFKMVREVREIESGRKNDRAVLREAIAYAKRAKATLLIAKLDRLARNVAFIANLMESGIEFRACARGRANASCSDFAITRVKVPTNMSERFATCLVSTSRRTRRFRHVVLPAPGPASAFINRESLSMSRRLPSPLIPSSHRGSAGCCSPFILQTPVVSIMMARPSNERPLSFLFRAWPVPNISCSDRSNARRPESPFAGGTARAAKRDVMGEFEPAGDVVNADSLIRVFGAWPSFHDAEIVWIRLDRGAGRPSLEAAFHLFRMTSELDERGYYVLRDHTLAKLRFDNIVLQELKWFNHQNSIDGLEIGPGNERRLKVEFPSNWGCDAQFECDGIEVLSVESYEPQQRHPDGISLDPPKPV